MRFHQAKPPHVSLAHLLKDNKKEFETQFQNPTKDSEINILAYCLMPTHFHFAIEAVSMKALSKFSNYVLSGYSHYFNILHNRKGPLWQGRSKKVMVETDEQLLHLTRYIHLNPVTAYLVNKPEDWKWSSYHEYIHAKVSLPFCSFKERIQTNPENYAYFVHSHIEHQRKYAQAQKTTPDASSDH